ncbi:MAG TPA: hypothetical protein VK604_21245, partial [Bryobacteraceae bacterium]|nr:hypothetical protein [Bryobacteraceae bacterium]
MRIQALRAASYGPRKPYSEMVVGDVPRERWRLVGAVVGPSIIALYVEQRGVDCVAKSASDSAKGPDP